MNGSSSPSSLPTDGLNIPLRASFSGMKRRPILALGHNSINPLLRLFEDHIESRVFLKSKKSYAEIEHIDTYQTLGTNNIIIVWKTGWFAFVGNVKNKDYLPELVRFFQNKNVPLGESAKKLVK